MKKVLLGLSTVLFVVSSVMEIEAMKHQLRRVKSESSLSDMRSTELHEVSASRRRNSLPSGSTILPEMKSGELSFKKITTPEVLDKYKHEPVVAALIDRLQEIQKAANPQELLTLSRQLISDDDEREKLFSVIGSDGIESLDNLCIAINERLLDLGLLDPYVVASSMFCSTDASEIRRCAKQITYADSAVTERVLYVAGLYIGAISWKKKGWIGTMDASPIMRRVLDRISTLELPKSHYILWGIKNALSDLQTQAMVTF